MFGRMTTGAAIATTVALAVALAGSMGALAATSPDRIALRPIDGGHWQGQVGLPDARGSADQALVRVVDGGDDHPEVAEFTGVARRATGEVGALGFTFAADAAGIIPCIKVAYTDERGTRQERMITPSRGRPVAGEPGWAVYEADAGLPLGGTIEAIEIGVHVEGDPPDPVRVRFDDIVLGDAVFTRAGDAAGR